FNLRDVYDDVQWHFRAGLGGRHYDLAAFRRYDTLARRAVAAERKRAAVSEELRILYVALTRARERLELVAAVEPDGLERLTRRRGADAQSWIEWVAPQLGEAVVGAGTWPAQGEASPRPYTCGEESCWEVHLHRGADITLGTPEPAAAVSSEQLDLVLRRLQAEYPHGGSSRLPSKVAVTYLSESRPDMDTERAVPLGEARAEPRDVQPAFIKQYVPTSADKGTAVHKLLSAIDPRELARYADEN
ncbi:MAG: hypothetical protein M3R04_07270, partial [bacterium]|nr:hypothetical protein [bacterium]